MAKAKWNGNNPESGIVVIKCPAGHYHYIHTKKTNPNGQGMAWNFNGNMNLPTFTPSINERTGTYVDPNTKGDPDWLRENSYHCHFIVTSGKIQFCGDCSHNLKGREMYLLEID